jgi:hypothetical protein
MWPFSSFARRKALRAAFSQYLPPDTPRGIAADATDFRPDPPVRARICFILLQVRDDDLAQASSDLATAIDSIVAHEGVVTEFMSSCILAVFSHPLIAGHDAKPVQGEVAREKAAAQLLASLGERVRLVCGDAEGLVGAIGIGSRWRLRHGCLVQKFATHLSTLLALGFGERTNV